MEPQTAPSNAPTAEPPATAETRTIKRRKPDQRRRQFKLQVRVDPEEQVLIEENASRSQMTTAAFLRQLGQGYIPPSKVDLVAVRELCQVAGDLGRLGGLLKLWIAEKQTGSQKGSNLGASVPEIDDLWQDIQKTYKLLKSKIEGLS